MKRFIEHEELARDSRFIRQDTRMSTVLASMPDDVDTLVYSSAVHPDNPEVKEALARSIPVVRRAEMLAEDMRLKDGIEFRAGCVNSDDQRAILCFCMVAGVAKRLVESPPIS